jgi:hypothetical protein
MESGMCIARWEQTVGYCRNLRLTNILFFLVDLSNRNPQILVEQMI